MIPAFKSIFDLLKTFPTEQDCINHLEILRWNGVIISPFDENSKVYKCTNNKYKCKATGKYFNVRTNTIFDNTKIPLQKWFLALYIFSSHKKGISSHQLAKDISVTQKSAWFLLHRLRYAFEHPNFHATLGANDAVEIDETFIGGQAKNKHSSKKTKTENGGTVHEQTPVIGMLERNGNLIAKVIPNRHKETLLPIIYDNVETNSVIMTDELPAYKDLKYAFAHNKVNHGAKEYVNAMAHTNSIEGFWSHLKRGIDGIYHWVSKYHLQSYVNEYTLRFNTRTQSTQTRFDLVLSGVAGKRLTYENLIN